MALFNFQLTSDFMGSPFRLTTRSFPGQIEQFWNSDSTSLYHQFSPYSPGTAMGSPSAEPFYYIYADQNKTFPNSALKSDTFVFPQGSAKIDVTRMNSFLASGRGKNFVTRQTQLQLLSPYNERQTYDQTSITTAAGLGLNPGSPNPERSKDSSSGGVVAGTTLQNNSDALPNANKSFASKGLLRAKDAVVAQSNLKSAWASQTGGSSSSGFSTSAAGLAKTTFKSTTPPTQTNAQYRSDEGAYGLMVAGGASKFSYMGANGTTFGFGQMWIAGANGGTGIRKNSEYPTAPTRLFVQATNGVVTTVAVSTTGGLNSYIGTVGAVGYTPKYSYDHMGYRYGDATDPNVAGNKEWQGSDVMYQYKYYADSSQAFPTKDPDSKVDTTDQQKTQLTTLLNDIKAASGGVYGGTTPDGIVLRNSTINYNYDRLFKTRDKGNLPNMYQFGFLKAYRDSGVRMLDNSISVNGNSLKLSTAFTADTLNTLNVLDSSQKDTATWSPFKDDVIALYFYDVVNDKYIPFRAAIKGVSESANASWEELPFIGRADKIYSYGGFNRNLSFNLQIVISSLKELAPTWQRINYMMTSYKPANYTKKASSSGGDLNYDRFMVPPMFMLTMGDLYRDQPILIQTMVMNIPEDASWETFNQENQASGWNYMANTIKAASGTLYAQVPREVELAVTAVLLEKERAVVGGANFAHAPRTEDFADYNTDTVPDSKALNQWSENLVVNIPNLTPGANFASANGLTPASPTTIPIPGATSLF